MTTRWHPDEQLIPAVRTGRSLRTYADLTPADRAWVIAGLSQEGHTAEHIADLLGCSLRTVRVVKADPAAAVCLAFMAEAAAFTAEMRLARSELARQARDVTELAAANKRLRDTLVRVTTPRDAAAPLCSKGLHPMDPYNVWVDKSGRRWCRGCHRDRQTEHRARKKLPA